MKLSVLEPVYNEIATIAEVITRVRAAPLQLPVELIFVDDCSVDGTREFLQHLVSGDGRATAEVKVVLHAHNRCKGAAIRTAISHATGTLVLIQDADPNMTHKIMGGCSGRSSMVMRTSSSATVSMGEPTVCCISGMPWVIAC